jgi:hypothetical protein
MGSSSEARMMLRMPVRSLNQTKKRERGFVSDCFVTESSAAT